MDVVNIYRYKTTNIGDIYSSPCLYFDWLKNVQKVDILMEKVDEVINGVTEKFIILGGGGLISNKDFDDQFKWISKAVFKIKVVWGAGHNTHNQSSLEKTNTDLDKFDLVGIRDFDTKYEWVPCASCLHKAFDKKYIIKHKIVVFEHKDFPIPIAEYPKRNNRSDNIEEILTFLGSGETIITNTYHGVYWGTLLQRKVILIDPFSSKFSKFKHPPTFSSIKKYRIDLNKSIVYPSALNDAREANFNFEKKVKEMFSIHT